MTLETDCHAPPSRTSLRFGSHALHPRPAREEARNRDAAADRTQDLVGQAALRGRGATRNERRTRTAEGVRLLRARVAWACAARVAPPRAGARSLPSSSPSPPQ